MAVAGLEDDAFVQWDDYLTGRCTADDLPFASPLPDWVLFTVNTIWLQRFRQTFVQIGERITCGETPYPRCMAERVALWITLSWVQEEGGDIASEMLDDDEETAEALPEKADLDDDWERVEDGLFDDDFDFKIIWLDNFTKVIFGDSTAAFSGHFGIDAASYHPFRWWETDQSN